jgi:TatD DNase family protein
MNLRLWDAHNHLQDERLQAAPDPWIALRQEGIRGMVVNGSSEADWPAVVKLAHTHPEVLPSFGYHPWYVRDRTPRWLQTLTALLDATPSAIGEIGLDRWIEGHDLADQEAVFVAQLRLAAKRGLPVSIHCLKAWGRLLEVLEREPRPACGWVLHSYGGPAEMIPALARLGAYFSLPGYFAHPRKQRQRATFLQVPPDRLLIETDAPDQLLPDDLCQYPLLDALSGKPINHPANLGAVYRFAADLFGEPVETLATRVEQNFLRVFGRVWRAREALDGV